MIVFFGVNNGRDKNIFIRIFEVNKGRKNKKKMLPFVFNLKGNSFMNGKLCIVLTKKILSPVQIRC